ncbi:carboxylating nicotinate-nucleotide diphosphorylase [Kiloniella laminariae]|uniref:nicotinate-nucleotide diphosphorylase (carboxylating) n=1 Tax=Kiloniella laminariae TaxID=454162 RepID=A0ABT4LIJ5_9PROT|nr:carboxylating nicotinate-nucleotide diphosphorylase [Kiloniella laminariae]MCZ4280928.1 carboxylating nicotinate-nucleotide diphosphorylase [Kiloniella laminariae]
MSALLSPLPRNLVIPAVQNALLEDLGSTGDLTSNSTILPDTCLKASVISRQEGCIAGTDFLIATMAEMSSAVNVTVLAEDGTRVQPQSVVATIEGPARAILAGERVGLNYLGHLSGIASATRTIVDLVAGLPVRITCTRKTTPGLRAFEKYAVRAGGGHNHRFGLYDGVMLKDNHIAAVVGDIGTAINRARASIGHMVKIELEVDTLEQLEIALPHKPDIILLDNMNLAQLRQAVKMVNGRAIVEASGGITAQTARAIAETGVDVLSLGWLTHSAPCLDLGLDIL